MRAIIGFCLLALTALPVWAVELVMVDQVGCIYCERWEEEIGPIYPKTDEGKFAPLRQIDIRDVAGEIEVARKVIFTPTFLVVEDGVELSRMEGYAGEDFFWSLLTKMLTDNTDYKEVPE